MQINRQITLPCIRAGIVAKLSDWEWNKVGDLLWLCPLLPLLLLLLLQLILVVTPAAAYLCSVPATVSWEEAANERSSL